MILLFLAFVIPLLPRTLPPDDPNRSRSLLDNVRPFLAAACAALTEDAVNTADASKLRPTRAPYYVCNGFCSNTFTADSRLLAFLDLLSMYVNLAFFLAEEIDCLYVNWIAALRPIHSPHPLRSVNDDSQFAARSRTFWKQLEAATCTLPAAALAVHEPTGAW